ncbi:MAG: hypothetical protein ACOC9E_02975 [Chloroflexota bacterium]
MYLTSLDMGGLSDPGSRMSVAPVNAVVDGDEGQSDLFEQEHHG